MSLCRLINSNLHVIASHVATFKSTYIRMDMDAGMNPVRAFKMHSRAEDIADCDSRTSETNIKQQKGMHRVM